jgi:class 3 adenylate cyclase/tetratricopeptide (TPR) repeat protein
MDCPSCAEPNPERARFCLACGRPLPQTSGRTAGARKVVTVVFSDLAGSTGLGERLDPEALSRVMSRWYAVAQTELARHGGTVQKFAGDAVMAVFGIPAAHEDDALRAVRAAAGLHQGLERLNDELEADWGVRLALHTGVNTGPVLAGDPGLGDAIVVGDAVNVAARLEQAAEPGRILLGRSTWALVRDAVEAEPVAPLALRGRERGEPAWLLQQVRPGAQAGRRRRQDTPFVGRDMELHLFDWVGRRAIRDGALHLVTVLGAAGVGKSRLVAEAMAAIEGEPLVLQGRCLPYGDGITLWPLAEVVRQAAGVEAADTPAAALARLARLLAAADDGGQVADRLGRLIGFADEPASIAEAGWAVGRFLEVVAATRPLVAAFDDLHWAEPAFLDLLERVAGDVRDVPVLLVAVARPELLDARPGWAGGRPNATTILLEPLAPDAAAELLDGLAGGAALPEVAIERMVAAAEGNPLFLEELLATLVEEGRLRLEGDGYRVAGDLDAGPPPSVQAVLAARLDRLEALDRGLLERAAVIGQEFDPAMVAELTEPAERGRMEHRLAGLARREWVRQVGGGGYRFRHLFVRDAVYDAMPKRVRAQLHERVADLVQATAGARVREYEEIIGYHLERAHRSWAELGPAVPAGLAERAVARLAAVGRRALDRGDMVAASSLLDRAAALAPTDSHLLDDLVESLVGAGEFERARVVLAAEAGGDEVGRAYAALSRLHLRVATEPDFDLEELRAQVLDASAVIDRLGDEQGMARTWRLLGYERLVRCRIEEAEAATATAVEHARRAGNGRVLAWGRALLAATAFWGPVPVADGIDRCRRILTEAADNPYVRTSALHVLGTLEAMRGDIDRARELVAEGAEVLARLGPNRLAGIAGQFAAAVELLAGDPVTAEKHLLAGYELLEEIRDTGAGSNVAADLAMVVAVQGRHEAALEWDRVSARLAPDQDLYVQIRRRAASARALAGSDRAKARRLAGEAVAMAERTDMRNLHADALVELAGTQDHDDAARPSLAEALALYEAKGNVTAAGAVKARLDACSGNAD